LAFLACTDDRADGESDAAPSSCATNPVRPAFSSSAVPDPAACAGATTANGPATATSPTIDIRRSRDRNSVCTAASSTLAGTCGKGSGSYSRKSVLPAGKEPPVPVDPKRTAVVLIEYQNDFTSKGGALHGAVQPVMEQTGMLENTRRLVEAARAAGATIVHAPITFAPGYGELSDHPYGILKGVVDSTAFVKGEWGAEIVDALAPQEGDVVVEGKRGLDTFATTNLDFILRARGITTIALGGFLTNCCVESTMRTGYEKGYEVITLSDCVAATSPEEHENAIRFDYPMFSDVMTSDAFADRLHGAAVGAD
jgi:nicotinamidase-related amidase